MLNDCIQCFGYSTQEARDKPLPIKSQLFSSQGASLRQSCKVTMCMCIYMVYNIMSHTAAQMWNLAINLPVMMGDRVPVEDANWECFLLLLDILQFCTARVSSSAHAGILEALIHNHHELFIRCYPDSPVTPKMHYMVHFPNQIIRYVGFYCHIPIRCTKLLPYNRTGPLISTWCMRMEAKNSYFKRAAQTSNFKNVPYTVAKRHQKLLCTYLLADNFFDFALECGPGIYNH